MNTKKIIAGMIAFGAGAGAGFLTTGMDEYNDCRKSYLKKNMNQGEFKGCEFPRFRNSESGYFSCKSETLEPIFTKKADQAGELCKKNASILFNMIKVPAQCLFLFLLIAGFPENAPVAQNDVRRLAP